MGDTWEDWDSEEEIPVPAPILARSATNADKFADEDAEVTDGPKWEGTVPEQKEVRSIALINPMDVRAGVETLGVARSPAGGFNRSFSRIQSLGRSVARSDSFARSLALAHCPTEIFAPAEKGGRQQVRREQGRAKAEG